jgi:hypothetical protein
MPREKDTSAKVTIIYDDEQGVSKCTSIRLKDEITKDQAIQKAVEFLKKTL